MCHSGIFVSVSCLWFCPLHFDCVIGMSSDCLERFTWLCGCAEILIWGRIQWRVGIIVLLLFDLGTSWSWSARLKKQIACVSYLNFVLADNLHLLGTDPCCEIVLDCSGAILCQWTNEQVACWLTGLLLWTKGTSFPLDHKTDESSACILKWNLFQIFRHTEC